VTTHTPLAAPVLLGIPFDAGSSYLRGAAEGPAAIRRALHSPSSNLWTEDGVDLGEAGRFIDAGNVDMKAAANPRAAITDAVGRVLQQGARPLLLGGDHCAPSCSAATTRSPTRSCAQWPPRTVR
jgi:arginase